MLITIAGCSSNASGPSKDQLQREQAIASLDKADSLNTFLQVESDNWKLGLSSLDVNFISERRRNWYVNNNPDLTPEMKQIIISGKWQIGMTKEDLYASLGLPDRNNRNVFQDNVREQLVYEYDIRVPRTADLYFYLEDGILTSWQD